MDKKGRNLKKVINSYLLAHPDDPYEDLDTLKEYLEKKNMGKISLKGLKDFIKNVRREQRKEKKLEEMEAKLFTRDGKPKEFKYGSSFCRNCGMYKDYEKECPYCGHLEMTI